MQTLNTRFDYDHVKSSNSQGWEQQWRDLLEGRFAIIGGDLVEDPQAPLFSLGLSVSEIEAAIYFSGYTLREVEWYSSQPDRFECADGEWRQISGWAERRKAASLLDALNKKLSDVDTAVATLQSGTFEYNCHKYHLDRDYISDQITALPFLPSNYSREWKTADKDGVNNAYATLDKAGIIAMGLACFAQFDLNWSAGEAVKKELKRRYSEGEDVSEFDIAL